MTFTALAVDSNGNIYATRSDGLLCFADRKSSRDPQPVPSEGYYKALDAFPMCDRCHEYLSDCLCD